MKKVYPEASAQVNDQMPQSVNDQMTRQEFLSWETASRDTIDFKRCYVDLAGGDLIAGLLLSQIMYWHLPAKNGAESKLIVNRDDHLWLAKERGDWWDECRITPKQYDRAAGILQGLGLIETRTMRFSGNPTKHIRICWEAFLRDLALVTMRVAGGNNDIPQWGRTKSLNGEERYCPNGKVDIDGSDKSLTEIIAQTPAEKTSKNTTTSTSTARSGVGEAHSNVVDIFDVLEAEYEKCGHTEQGEDQDDLDDVFAVSAPATEVNQPAPTPQKTALELTAQAVEDSLCVTRKAVQDSIQRMRQARDNDEQIACALKEARERAEEKERCKRIGISAAAWWVGSIDGVAAEMRSNALKAARLKEASQRARQAKAANAVQRKEKEETKRLDDEADRAARRETVLLQSGEVLVRACAAARSENTYMAQKFAPAEQDLECKKLIKAMKWATFLLVEGQVNAILNHAAPAQ